MKKVKSLIATLLILAIVSLSTLSVNAVILTQDSFDIPSKIDGKSVISEITHLRDEYGKTFLMEDDTYTYINYGTPIHYEDNGEWKEFDLSLSPNLFTGTISNNCSATDVSFSSSSPAVSLSNDETTLSWSVTQSDISQSNTFSLFSNNNQPSLTATIATANVTDITDNHSAVNYSSENADYSIEYKVYPYRVKENIIINSAQTSEFDIELNANGMIARKTSARTVTLFDANGNEKYEVNVPYMYDALGAESTDIGVTLVQNGNNYIINIKPSEEWLNSPQRVYPVIIDPDYYLPTSGTVDTYVQQSDSAGEFKDEPKMYVGTYNSKKCYSYVYIPTTVSTNCQRINSATLKLHLSSSTSSSAGPFTLYRATESWNESTISYSNQPEYSTIDSSVDFQSDNGKYIEFDITSWAKKVTIGQYANYGFRIADVGDSGVASYFRTTEYDDTSRYPRITINYKMYVFGASSAYAGTFPLNNNEYYTFLQSYESTSLAAMPYSTSSSTANEKLLWDICNISYTGRSVIRSNKYPNYALYADSSGLSLKYLQSTDFYSETTASGFQWIIFEYSSGEYCILNKATGKALSIISSVPTVATPNGTSNQKWKIGYTYCSSIEIDDINVGRGEFVSYSDLDITFNNGQSTPTSSANLDIYTISTNQTDMVTFGTTGFTIHDDVPMRTIRITVGRKDTAATCTFDIVYIYEIDEMATVIGELYDVAYSYYSNSNNRFNDSIKATLGIIREMHYNAGMFNIVCGTLDSDFKNYIINNYNGLYNFFYRDSKYLKTKDPVTGETIDIPHMAATMNAIYSTDIVIIEEIICSEEIVNELAGWAGDFQSLILNYCERFDYTYYGDIYDAFYEMIGNANYSFSYDDFLADVDAINLTNTISTTISSGIQLKNALLSYYIGSNGIVASKRVTSVIGSYSANAIYTVVRKYAAPYFYENIPWPIFADIDNGQICAIEISETEQQAFATAYADYLVAQRELEE